MSWKESLLFLRATTQAPLIQKVHCIFGDLVASDNYLNLKSSSWMFLLIEFSSEGSSALVCQQGISECIHGETILTASLVGAITKWPKNQFKYLSYPIFGFKVLFVVLISLWQQPKTKSPSNSCPLPQLLKDKDIAISWNKKGLHIDTESALSLDSTK